MENIFFYYSYSESLELEAGNGCCFISKLQFKINLFTLAFFPSPLPSQFNLGVTRGRMWANLTSILSTSCEAWPRSILVSENINSPPSPLWTLDYNLRQTFICWRTCYFSYKISEVWYRRRNAKQGKVSGLFEDWRPPFPSTEGKRWAVRAKLWLKDVLRMGTSPGLHFTEEIQAANSDLRWKTNHRTFLKALREQRLFVGLISECMSRCEPYISALWFFESRAHLSLRLRDI